MRRAVVFGALGFVGSGIARQLAIQGHTVVGISRRDIDLSSDGAPRMIQDVVRDDDRVVFAAAVAPCKTLEHFEQNITMFTRFLKGIADKNLATLCYVSSDAVYCDTRELISESTPTKPESLHGLMHITREKLLTFHKEKWLILRPTLVYGLGDPHNGYGPNRFIRLARAGEDILLFGDGEELRDHIHISDLSLAAASLIASGATGTYNVATGRVSSFHEVAEIAVGLSAGKSRVLSSRRDGPLPHLGLRQFDTTLLRQAIPQFDPRTTDHCMRAEYERYGP